MKYKSLTALVFLSACAMQPKEVQQTTTANFEKRAKITQKYIDKRFYAPFDTRDFKKCITPQGSPFFRPRHCEQADFKRGREVDAKVYSLSISSPQQPSTQAKVKDLALQSLAHQAKKLGYSHLAVLSQQNLGSCSSTPTVTTFGILSNNTYFGTSTLRNESACSALYTVTTLFFYQPQDVQGGLLVGTDDRDNARWFNDLYFNMADYMHNMASKDENRKTYFQGHPIDPWRHYRSVDAILADAKLR